MNKQIPELIIVIFTNPSVSQIMIVIEDDIFEIPSNSDNIEEQVAQWLNKHGYHIVGFVRAKSKHAYRKFICKIEGK